jgi:toxin FitB
MRRRDRLPLKARQWLQARHIDELYISALTVMEVEIGVLRLERRNPGQAAMLRAGKDGRLMRHFSRTHSRSRPYDLRALRDASRP